MKHFKTCQKKMQALQPITRYSACQDSGGELTKSKAALG
jgi:hypothetical protein